MTGFTMVELMVAIAVAGILLGIGVPSYRSFVAGQRIRTATSELNYALLQARSEAIKRNAAVTVTPAGSCWQAGWTVSVGSVALAAQGAYRDLSFAASSSATSGVTFNGEGRIDGSDAAIQIASRTARDVSSRCVALDLSGLPSTTATACRLSVVNCP